MRLATKSVLPLLVFFFVIIIISSSRSAYADNSNSIAVPVSRHPIKLDDVLNYTEWNDAFRFNFTSPRLHEGYVIIYLKYEVSDKALSGGFYIPDNTPFFDKTSPDQISFNFDTLHNKSEKVGPKDHYIVFVRDGHAEYYKGGNTGLNKIISIANSTNSEHTLKLTNPFSKLDFRIVSNNTSWYGKFEIYFNEDPDTYGFAIQQVDSFKKNGKINHFFINYPKANFTQADNPSTWGDINFYGISQYAKHIKKLCTKNSAISPNNVVILCLRSMTPASIEENVPSDIIVEGLLGNLIDGKGIRYQNISAYVVDSNGRIFSPATKELTGEDGTFLSTIKDVKLNNTENDTYSLFIKPTSTSYSGLNITTGLDIRKHLLTFEEVIPILSTYFGVVAAGIAAFAFIPRIKKYSDENKERGIELKGTHTQEFIKGYFKGIQGYWWNRGLAEGYSGLPLSSLLQKNANYTQKYKDGRAEYLTGYPGTKKCGIDLGKLPTHTNDNYRDFYLGLDQGGDAYDLVDGTHYLLYNGPPGHTAEYYAGWKFGYGLGLAVDSDCGGVAVVK